jgi:hypothetical protein
MVLTKEQRIELLAKARLAKANKKASIKEEPDEEQEETPVINVSMPEPEPPTPKVKKTRKKNEIAPLPVPVQVIQEPDDELDEPLPIPKKKALPTKWLKNPKTEPERVCCNEKVSKEEYLIDDEKPQIIKEIVIPAKKEIKKPRVPRSSTRTLDLVEPPPIEEFLQDMSNDAMKYRPPQRRQPTSLPPVSTPSAPINIVRSEIGLRLFDY